MLAWTSEGAWDRFAGPVTRLTRLIPEEVLVGYHLCYGTFPEWPMYEARDLGLLVRMANHAVAALRAHGRLGPPRRPALPAQRGRSLLPAARRPRARAIPACSSDIVLPLDGVPGLKRRHATASKYLGDFGIAMYCGFGRQPGADGIATMREHRDTVRAIPR